MADPYTTVDLDTPDSAEVDFLVAETGLDRFAVVGRLVAFWCWIERQAVDGLVRFATPAMIAARLQCDDKFVAAMRTVRFVDFNDEGAVIPGWNERFSKAAKQRRKDAERKSFGRLAGGESGSCPEVVRDPSEKNRTESGQNRTRVRKGRNQEGEGENPSLTHSLARPRDEDVAEEARRHAEKLAKSEIVLTADLREVVWKAAYAGLWMLSGGTVDRIVKAAIQKRRRDKTVAVAAYLTSAVKGEIESSGYDRHATWEGIPPPRANPLN